MNYSNLFQNTDLILINSNELSNTKVLLIFVLCLFSEINGGIVYPKYISGSFCVHYSSTYYSSVGTLVRKREKNDQVSTWYKLFWLHIQSISRKSICAFCTEKAQRSGFDDTASPFSWRAGERRKREDSCLFNSM